MTGQTIRSKNCKTGSLLLTLGAATLLTAASAFGAAAPKLPVIQQVGVVPVQWEGEDGGLAAAQQNLSDALPKAVRAARRFRVLSDDLVAGLWQDGAGRKELSGEFELHAFTSLTAAPRGDVVTLTARLLDQNLKTLLIESDTVKRDWLAAADGDASYGAVEKLVFRLYNRIPVDVSVTSVQGAYITLSGGQEQGIEIGDNVDLVRATIRSVHPANGSWLEFGKQPLGTAQVIETKSHTSVAKLIKLTVENAVEVGDGARIPAIAGRAKFARVPGDEGLKDSGDPNTIIVPPLYQGGQPVAKPAVKPAAPVAAVPPPPTDGSYVAQNDPAPPTSSETAAQETPPADQSGSQPPPADGATTDENFWDQVSFGDMVPDKFVDDMTIYTGPQWWSVKSRDFSSSGRFPWWLVNHVGVSVTRTLFFKIKVGFGGGLLLGQTAKGNYIGYDSHARIYWEDQLNIADGLITGWHAGGHSSFSGINVTKENYGGGDWVRGGGFGGLFGTIHAGPANDRYDWFGDIAVMPLNIGRIGYNGGRQVVESSFGWDLSLGAFMYAPPGAVQFGGGFDLGSEVQTLKNGKRPTINEYAIKAMAKVSF